MFRFITRLFNRKRNIEEMCHCRNPKCEGKILEVLMHGFYRVRLDNMDHTQLICHLSGKMRRHQIKLLSGDTVDVELSPYDSERGRITGVVKLGDN